MIAVLLINAHVIVLISSHTYLPTTKRDGYANIEPWYGGTLIYAHNNLAGAWFDDAETMTAIYADGTTKDFIVSQTAIIQNEDWTSALLEYSTPETITLATCYTNETRWIAELVEITEK